jgi:transcriptional regulator with XRE-family HTH domain
VEPFGRRVAKWRVDRGLTQARLAERIAVSRVALSHLEAGMTVAGERTVALLAGVFGVEAHELAAGTDYPLAKAERLPLAVTRYTEVDHELALLAADLRWIDDVEELTPAGRRLTASCAAGWVDRLARLAQRSVDPLERDRVRTAHRGVLELVHRLR